MTGLPGAFGAEVDLATLLTYGVGLVTFLSFYTLWQALLERDPRAARTRLIEQRREELRAGAAAGSRRAGRRKTSRVVKLGQRFQLARATQVEKARERLARAGLRSRDAANGFLLAKAVLPMAATLLAVLLTYVLNVVPVGPGLRPVVLVVAVFLGLLGPDMYISNLASKRRQALQRTLPDGLDLLVVCAEAGLSLDTALNRVADEIGPSAPELADELAMTAVELNFLPERRQALLNLGRRCDLPAIRGVVNTLVQTEKYGTPLSQSLRVLSGEFREQRMMRAEEKAARLPATLTVPMIVFILPTLFVVLIGPALIDVFDQLSKN